MVCEGPDEQLDGEPSIAHALHEEEGVVWVGAVLVQGPGCPVHRRPHRQVVDDRNPHIWVGLETEGQDRNTDKEDRDDSYPLPDRDLVLLEFISIKNGFVSNQIAIL